MPVSGPAADSLQKELNDRRAHTPIHHVQVVIVLVELVTFLQPASARIACCHAPSCDSERAMADRRKIIVRISLQSCSVGAARKQACCTGSDTTRASLQPSQSSMAPCRRKMRSSEQSLHLPESLPLRPRQICKICGRSLQGE